MSTVTVYKCARCKTLYSLNDTYDGKRIRFYAWSHTYCSTECFLNIEKQRVVCGVDVGNKVGDGPGTTFRFMDSEGNIKSVKEIKDEEDDGGFTINDFTFEEANIPGPENTYFNNYESAVNMWHISQRIKRDLFTPEQLKELENRLEKIHTEHLYEQ